MDLVLVLLLCWWRRSGADLVLVWCLVLLVWCLVSLVVVLVVVVVLLPLLWRCYCCCLDLAPLLLLFTAAGAGGSGGGGGGGAAAAAGGGNVLVQAEVGRNHADVEFAIGGGVCNMKRTDLHGVFFQLKWSLRRLSSACTIKRQHSGY